MGELMEIAEHDLEAVRRCLSRTDGARPVVLLLYARDCPPCKQLHPEVARIAAITPEIDFFALRADAHPELCQALGVTGFPAQVFVDGHGHREILLGGNWRQISPLLDRLLANTLQPSHATSAAP